MQSEIVDATDPCPTCGMKRAFFVMDTGLTEAGDTFVAYRRERPPHTDSECERMVTLSREQWPTLW